MIIHASRNIYIGTVYLLYIHGIFGYELRLMHINQSINHWIFTSGRRPVALLRLSLYKRGLPARRHPSARQYEPYQCEVAAVIGMEGAFAKGIFSEVERMERVTVFQWLAYHSLVTIDIAALLWHHNPTSPKPHEGLKFSLAWPSWIAAAVLPRYEKRSCLRRLTSIRRMGKTRPKNKK